MYEPLMNSSIAAIAYIIPYFLAYFVIAGFAYSDAS